MNVHRIEVIDSHTGGEPTRVVIAGGPDLGGGPLSERRQLLRDRHGGFRRAVVNEPRGSDVFVGALLCKPHDPRCVAGMIFFNNVGYIGMCGHGTIGVTITLAHLDCLPPGEYLLETPVGVVTVNYLGDNEAAVQNVPSYRYRKNVAVDVEGIGEIHGDIAWGGNWFFLVEEHGQDLQLERVDRLVDFTWKIRQALERQGITGKDNGHIDHIELFGPPIDPRANCRNFVLCPGGAYDRSPCGTGTSAKLACLIDDAKWQPGDVWRQESIVGSVFDAWAKVEGEKIIPTIKGTAHVTAEATLLQYENDPFREGIGP